MALGGSYPSVGLVDARRARDVARLQKHEGSNPVQVRKAENLKAATLPAYRPRGRSGMARQAGASVECCACRADPAPARARPVPVDRYSQP
jgi:hypothetical protein